MINTILINDDKSLIKTVFRPIHEGENRVDEIQFLFGEDLYPDFDREKIVVMLQAILPYPDEEKGTETTGKMRYMSIDEDLYKNKYRMSLPVTTVLTKSPGEVIFWFMFFDTSDPNHIQLLKTEDTILMIERTLKGSSALLNDDETYDVLTQIKHDVEELKGNKMDKHFDYDEENQTIQFYVNGAPIGEPVKLDTEVGWKDWED